jgi:hypothetical protein
MDRSELRRSLLDYLKARAGDAWAPLSAHDFRLYTEGEAAPAPLTPPDLIDVEDVLEDLAFEGFIERREDGNYQRTPSSTAISSSALPQGGRKSGRSAS